MASIQTSFARIEKKYLVDERQYRALSAALAERMKPDEFGTYTICNIYYDTPDYRLIRASLDKPVYKEKLRLRSYGVVGESGRVFVELKKKYKGVVYKRRATMPLAEARAWLANGGGAPESQIRREIDWFLRFYRPEPAVFLAYDREALACPETPGLRVTFDSGLRWREDRLDLSLGDDGAPLTDPGTRILEIKIPGAMPLWLCHQLDRLEIFPASFSKYGTYYKQQVLTHTERKEAATCA